ncbi:hypothetical protein [uncultured Victivallis sp.]|uniref:hypothetical protein n=1 Tax=uncultured Victivallis sp. TaxID=354118 RepID=UPI0025FBC48F|nr:hypothetical protein [uncultured Victivallis sp.]
MMMTDVRIAFLISVDGRVVEFKRNTAPAERTDSCRVIPHNAAPYCHMPAGFSRKAPPSVPECFSPQRVWNGGMAVERTCEKTEERIIVIFLSGTLRSHTQHLPTPVAVTRSLAAGGSGTCVLSALFGRGGARNFAHGKLVRHHGTDWNHQPMPTMIFFEKFFVSMEKNHLRM